MGWEGIKGFLPIKEGKGGKGQGKGERDGREKVGSRGSASGRGILLQGLREIDAPAER